MTRIAYLGPAGTFTEQAVHAFALPAPELVAVDSSAEALAAVAEELNERLEQLRKRRRTAARIAKEQKEAQENAK